MTMFFLFLSPCTGFQFEKRKRKRNRTDCKLSCLSTVSSLELVHNSLLTIDNWPLPLPLCYHWYLSVTYCWDLTTNSPASATMLSLVLVRNILLRLDHNLSSLCHYAITGTCPHYLVDLLHVYIPSRQLLSTSDGKMFRLLTFKPKHNGKTILLFSRSLYVEQTP